MIKDVFKLLKDNPSDINEHLETLKLYSSKCSHVTEFGTRFGDSTVALAMGEPKTLITYDIKKHDGADYHISLVKNYYSDKHFDYIIQDVLKIHIAPTELLFIDTLHTYSQLSKELKLHANKVSKYIIMHDTVSFGNRDETIYEHASTEIKQPSDKTGLMLAMVEFLHDNKNWLVEGVYSNNNGLVVLKRI